MARKIKNQTLKKFGIRSLSSLAIVTLIIGTIFYHEVESWSWLNSFYFSTITLTTVGYGDLHPTTDISKIFTVFYVIIGIGIIFAFVNHIAKRRINKNS